MSSSVIERLKTQSHSPWSFATFMETALYDPKVGYYMKDRQKLGKDGDFYTSNHVHPVFAETFARFFLDVITKENMKAEICEWGAGDGSFACNILAYMREQSPEVFEKMTYYIIESSPYHQSILLDRLALFKKQIKIYSTLEELKKEVTHFQGIIFSNELIDAFPVHIIEKTSEGLKEVMLEVEGEHLAEKLMTSENNQVLNWLDKFGPTTLPEGHRFEVSLSMKEWLVNVSTWLEKGLLVTVDYGYRNEEFQWPERKDGSIRGYRNHEMVKDPLKYPGSMDLTSHIQWDAYEQIAKNQGLTMVCHDRQDKFLLKAGLFSFLQSPTDMNPFSDVFKKNRAIQSLVHPEGISTSFQVNVQGRGLTQVEKYLMFQEDPYQLKKP
ncbi:class I SAM-dependent methyltransferase [Salipaludibacillus sp. HK11]|uniref:class I SAM-dependent methyltransferase n=1 Tax=Salipaludibacillus sp. HK11 TaxID=3394320 RepID=UPI0039FC2596